MKERLVRFTYKEYVRAILTFDNSRADMLFAHLMTLAHDKKWWEFWK